MLCPCWTHTIPASASQQTWLLDLTLSVGRCHISSQEPSACAFCPQARQRTLQCPRISQEQPRRPNALCAHPAVRYPWPQPRLGSFPLAQGVCDTSGLFRACFKLSTSMACCFPTAVMGCSVSITCSQREV